MAFLMKAIDILLECSDKLGFHSHDVCENKPNIITQMRSIEAKIKRPAIYHDGRAT
jgi:hypothetical protein